MVIRPGHRDLERSELRELVLELAGRPEAWRHLVRHDPAARSYAQLHRDDHVAVWLNCWLADHDTGFHDHDLSAGAVAVVEGRVREERLVLGGPPRSLTFAAGGAFEFGASDIHRVLHAGSAPAVTLHAYSPPLRRMGSYEVQPDGSLRRHSIPSTEELRPRGVAAVPS
jgi:predicted metal-dependent enzyme (double-stranded beta helix superfamily)